MLFIFALALALVPCLILSALLFVVALPVLSLLG